MIEIAYTLAKVGIWRNSIIIIIINNNCSLNADQFGSHNIYC